MIHKVTISLLTILLFSSCSSDRLEANDAFDAPHIQVAMNDASVVEQEVRPDGLDLFIEEMAATNYLLDTARIQQTLWSVLGKKPTKEQDWHVFIEIPFPVKTFQRHFSNPKTYFFAHWNEEQKTFKNGNDYLLLTWTIDSLGIEKEEVIYHALH